MTAEIRRRILGSETPQAAPTVGSFALAKVQDEAPEAIGRFDADVAGENITKHVLPWLMIAFPGQDFDDEELPRWQSNMGKTPSTEHVQAAIAAGLPVDGDEVAKRWTVPLVKEDPDEVLIMTSAAPPPVVARPDEEEEEEEPEEDADESAE